jgi:hypothetical protein
MRDRACGVFQLSGPVDASYADIARYLVRRTGAAQNLVQEVSAYSAGLPAGSTPLHTTLDSRRLRDLYELEVPDIWQVLEGFTSVAASFGDPGREVRN